MKRERSVGLKIKLHLQRQFGQAVIQSVEEWGRNPDLSDVFLNEGKIPRDEMKIGIICAACVVSI